MLHNMATYQSEPLTLVFTDIAALRCQCSQKQVTEQSATLHNSISNTDENCDSVSVSQQLLHHLGLKMKGPGGGETNQKQLV